MTEEFISSFNFKTNSSNDITIDLLNHAIQLIDRLKGFNEIEKYINDVDIVSRLEGGIFEFALIHIVINGFPYHFVSNIYYDKLFDICANLDPDNVKVNNKTLKSNLIEKTFDAYFVPFFPPYHLHPQKWADIIRKREYHEETMNNLGTTDLYKCRKCGNKKSKITELQLRCADEPSQKFVVCMVCHATFITS